MELFNWGTFDENVWKIVPGGETSLLTGANGSGKTTFVDALLTLIVPEKKHRFYNQSSGSEKKGDRTEESYVMGGYGNIHTEGGQGSKTLYLRESKEQAYSILLAHFANEADQFVTLFQVRWFSGGDMRRVFAIAYKPMHIEDDFRPFDLNGSWRRRIDQQYNKGSRKQVEWFDAASKYAQRMVDVMGMQSMQALSLFNQTMGIKVLGDLNEFIRSNMLEPRNMEQEFQELKQHLSTLIDAQRNIEKTEEQIKLLKPLERHYHSFKEQADFGALARQEVETAKIWKNYTKFHLLDSRLKELELDLASFIRQSDAAKQKIDALREEERQTLNQLEQNKAGQRLQQLEKEKEALEQQVKEAAYALKKFTEWCESLRLSEINASDEPAYQRIKKEAERTDKRLATEIRNNKEDEYEAQDRLKKGEGEKKIVENELNVLVHSKNNIPAHLINLRRSLCGELKLEEEDIPFVGELMQVRPEYSDWQPALEKLLYSLSTRMLVPDKYYKRVNRYVNNTNLRGRLVYNHVKDIALRQHADNGTIWHKMEFHPDHPLSAWVSQQIIQHYAYACVESEKTLERYERAITIQGLIKNKDRHEKDDRPQSNDASRYVMGWNNEKKKEALQARRLQLVTEMEQAEEALQRSSRKETRLQQQVFDAKNIREHSDFKSINVAALQQAIHENEEHAAKLKKSSDQLKTLTQQLEEIRIRLVLQEKESEQLVGKKVLTENAIHSWEKERQQLNQFVALIQDTDKDMLLQFQQKHANIAGEEQLTLENIEVFYGRLMEKAEQAAKQHEEAAGREGRELDRAITRIKNPPLELLQRFTDWAADTHSLSAEREHADEYIEWLQKLESENLPHYKKDFERLLHDTAVIKMGVLNEELESWERKIKNSISTLNQSLGGINFNRLPDTYIQLGIRPVTDTMIKEFRSRLLNALPQAADWQQNSFENKAAHFKLKVQSFIDTLDESESYRSRVLDVRNWFEFWADEKFRETNELKKTYRQMGQLSGGEKAQLTYTILCSAIAYQFGITREGRNSKSLRFIAVDESFSNQDEEKATYLMELCKQLHLQLLVVTPSDKIQIVENFIAHVHLVQRVNNRHSILYNMTKKELKEKKELIMNE
ncbi:ATP-binding protein [Puia sp.]|uniref:ATP-binding protein n=1 Tax=Puia sp. TaxID=2045100 RepID=UPI002D7F5C2B|nr:SbcC/MukB-like Walker B domain-containing protein [Puia sp.]